DDAAIRAPATPGRPPGSSPAHTEAARVPARPFRPGTRPRADRIGAEGTCACRGRTSTATLSARRRLDLRRASVAARAQDLLGDRLALHVRRALVDRTDLGVAIELLRRELGREADAAVQLDAEARRALGDLRGVELRHRRFGEKGLPRV